MTKKTLLAAAALVALSARAELGALTVKTPWRMGREAALALSGAEVSKTGFDDSAWLPATVPGTVLNAMVENKLLPEPYYGLNNKKEEKLIPDLNQVGRDYYTAWFRTVVKLPADYRGRTVWLRPEGINYRGEIWLNGRLAGVTAGMFARRPIDVTSLVKPGEANALAVKVFPVDFPGDTKQKDWGAANGEWRNGGDGEIGRNVTMLMSAGWDFTFSDGIRDRNTGIWKDIVFFATGAARLDAPFVKTKFTKKDFSEARLEAEVDVANARVRDDADVEVVFSVPSAGIRATRRVRIGRGGRETVKFTETLANPKLWWPVNKGPQNLYDAVFTVTQKGAVADEKRIRFGVREAGSDQSGPDRARQFYVNGRKIFIRGTNWIPEAMLRTDDARMEAEVRLLAESGVNLVRLWGGGIAESDLFYDLCDRYGLLVWQEFWMTGDTRHPEDEAVYYANVEDTVKRIRHHASLCHYVASNESTEMPGMRKFILSLDDTRSYMMQSECDGVHDGSPYKCVNPMRYYEDSASDRGSRVYGFNPEYGTCALPDAEYLRSFMPEKLLWPMDRAAWKYREGGGFDDMTTVHDALVRGYGEAKTLEDYTRHSEAADALSHRALWETWNLARNRATGLLFWYANTPVPKIGSHCWDHSLGLTSAFFAQKSALEPLHAQYEYLKDRVSVVSDIPDARDLEVAADVYDFDSKKVWSKSAAVKVPGETCVDAFTIPFGELALDRPHFIRLSLREKGREIASTFYWRSAEKYGGRRTVTGPCVGGFAALDSLPEATLSMKTVSESDRRLVVEVRNTGGTIAFLAKLLLRGEDGRQLKPCFYTDNFFSLVPGESRTVTIDKPDAPAKLELSAWNCRPATSNARSR